MNKIKVWYGPENNWIILNTEKSALEIYGMGRKSGCILAEDNKVVIPFEQVVMIEKI